MDVQTLGAYGGLLSLLIHTLSAVASLVNHKRLRSSCCGRTTEMSFDVDNTTPREH